MKTVDKKFQKEIEVERLWAATGLGKSGSLSIMPFYFLIVIGLWDKASHTQLLVWLFISCITNIFRWYVLHFYRSNKAALVKNVRKFKNLILLGGVLIGINWVLCFVLFQQPGDPANLLITCFPPIFHVMGTMVTWFSYFPAVVAVSLPPTITLIYSLFQYGGKSYLILAAMFSILPFLSYLLSVKLSNMLDYALVLSFENAELRRESEEKSLLLETALENMAQGISMADKNDQLRMWNGQFVNLLGTDGQKVSANAFLSEILSSANPPVLVEADGTIQYRLADGQVYVVRQTTLAQGGRLLTYTDITDLYNREQALEKASKEAVQANAAKTRFLAAASHDLRQPIHALGLFFAELAEQVRNPKTEPVIAQVQDSIEAINSMLNALLDVSKLDAGIVKPDVKACSLGEILSRLNAEFQPIARENHNRLKVRPSKALILTDSAMLERMLRNLISNALRHTENGRILVGVRRRLGEKLEIQILDTGHGIPEDQFEEIFVEFHQLHNPQRDRRQGLGLGLAIVKRLANLLAYEINVVSKLGRGSCFSITLPLSPKLKSIEELPVNSDFSDVTQPLTGCKLLVLDDDVAVREGMTGLLTRWGCDVISASTPQEAREKLARLNVRLDLLVVDYRLPDNISGIEAGRVLQDDLGYPVGVLVITGDTGPERLREAEASGFPLLHKPVQPAKLRSTLQYLMSKLDKTYH